jgi:putative spermidine/putrescine transport system permease protein
MITSTLPRAGPGRRLSRVLWRHPLSQLVALLAAPLAWLVVAYLGSLGALLITSLFTTDAFTTELVREVTFENIQELWTNPTFRTVTLRTVFVATSVTVIDLTLALPLAFFLAKVARRRSRTMLAVAIVLPLWASYLVKGYAWRVIFDPAAGVLEKSIGWSPGFGLPAAIIVLSYLWLPYMILPLYAGLERLPDSFLEASGDLGAKAGRTFWSVVLPLLKPAIIAGCIFTFSLSLGDYIVVQIVGGKAQTLGNVIYRDFGANSLPEAATLALIPVVLMAVLLIGVRRTGALENL